MFGKTSTRYHFVLVIMFAAASAAAAPFSKVEIAVNAAQPCRFNLSDEIDVVVNGDERHRITATFDKVTKHWTGEQHERSVLPYDELTATASLRALHHSGGRTGCKPVSGSGVGPKSDPNETIALFEFDCNNIDVTHVALRASPVSVSLGYIRHLPNDEPECDAGALYEMGSTEILDVWASETVKVVIAWQGRSMQDAFATGLPLFEPDDKHPDQLTFSKEVRRSMHKCDGVPCLARNDIGHVLMDARSAGSRSSAPNVSVAAIDVDMEALRSADVKRFTVTTVN